MQIVFPEWREMQADSKYPFADTSLLSNGNSAFTKETFVDARLFAIGGKSQQFLSSVEITPLQATISISDESGVLSSGLIAFGSGQSIVTLTDQYGRPAGILVSSVEQLNIIAAWPIALHEFTPDQTGFDATVIVPTPQVGVRGFLVEGRLFTADVYLMGEQGVFITQDGAYIRVDIIGDPRAQQRFCEQIFDYQAPWFIRKINGFTPDEFGEWKLLSGTVLATDTALRVEPMTSGLGLRLIGPVVPNGPA